MNVGVRGCDPLLALLLQRRAVAAFEAASRVTSLNAFVCAPFVCPHTNQSCYSQQQHTVRASRGCAGAALDTGKQESPLCESVVLGDRWGVSFIPRLAKARRFVELSVLLKVCGTNRSACE